MGALTLGKSEAISVTAEWIFSEHGTKLRTTERERGLAVKTSDLNSWCNWLIQVLRCIGATVKTHHALQ